MTTAISLLCAVAGGPLALGALAAAVLGRRGAYVTPGLLFHSVEETPGLNMSHYARRNFREVLVELLRRGYIPVHVSSAGHPPLARKPVAITFDDGLESLHQYALPHLQDCGVTSTVFVVAGYLGATTTWDVFAGGRHLSAAQVREFSSLGHEIGSHTMTHADLTRLGKRDLRAELLDSKHHLEDITGQPVVSLSFPHGNWNTRVWNEAREIGYRAATLYRAPHPRDRSLVPVYGVYRFDSPMEVIDKIEASGLFCPSRAISRIMAQFARGTPVWKFRNSYRATSD